MALKPKVKRQLARILPFGLIWLTTSWIFMFSDLALTGNRNLNPETDITLSWPIFLFATVSLISIGWLVGAIEMVFFERRFSGYSLTRKIISKFIIYLSLIITVIVITYPIAAAMELSLPIFHIEIWSKAWRFFQSITFLNTILQLSFSLFISLIYAAVSENIGHNVLLNFFTGKYHKPKIEHRIFMFLDMKDSTTIAEKLGHVKYFELLRKYYAMMSDSIINHYGEVYQYIGDEVVVSWEVDKGINNNNCIECFNSIKKQLKKQALAFEDKYGAIPYFKAGMHIGDVTTGEIGALKKEIVFTGDVLNTTARIQSMCKEYGQDLIISEELLHQLNTQIFSSTSLGEITLKGKTTKISLFGVTVRK